MTPCIEVQGWKFSIGYVRKKYQGKKQYAHRIAWQKAFGPIPEGIKVLHKCDNPACINPDHLFLGTHADNMADCREKGRTACQRGSSNGLAKLTETTAVAAMARLLKGGETRQQIADAFGVSPRALYDLWHGKTWAHLFKPLSE